MNRAPSKATAIGISLIGLVLLPVFLLPRTAWSADVMSAPQADQNFEPLVPTVPVTATGIYGLVTFEGVPIGGIQFKLDLCDYIWPHWACGIKASITTQPDGTYQFMNAPSLGTLQQFRVHFENNSYNPSYINYWSGPSIYSYTQGANVPGGDFDIATVPLVSPADGVTVTLPYSFTWTPRAGTPSDTYQFFLLNFNEARSWRATVGHAGNYPMEVLPPGFVSATPFDWAVIVKSPDGGYGATNTSHVTILGPTSDYKMYLPIVLKPA